MCWCACLGLRSAFSKVSSNCGIATLHQSCVHCPQPRGDTHAVTCRSSVLVLGTVSKRVKCELAESSLRVTTPMRETRRGCVLTLLQTYFCSLQPTSCFNNPQALFPNWIRLLQMLSTNHTSRVFFCRSFLHEEHSLRFIVKIIR